jgi:ADP-ribosylglycohydrolase
MQMLACTALSDGLLQSSLCLSPAASGLSCEIIGIGCLLQMSALKEAEQPWQDFLASPVWAQELAVAQQVAPGFQIAAVDAVAASLWAAVSHWHCPADAVVAAVHYGGDTDTIACMTGRILIG